MKMVVLVIVSMILITVLLGSVVPVIQFIKFKNKPAEKRYKYYFTEELLNFDMDNLNFENIDVINERKNNRLYLADRGWIRCPNGTVMSDRGFEEKKALEYGIELP